MAAIERMNKVEYKRLEKLVAEIFTAHTISGEDANCVAKHLVLANLRGIESHGVVRVKPYIDRLKLNLVESKNNIQIEKDFPSFCKVNGGNNLGIIVATKAVDLAINKAKATGLACVGVYNSNHCGMLADYTNKIADAGCIGFAVSNAPSSMAPWGAKAKYFGTNPLSYAIPTFTDRNIVFDMATSVVARGKITYALKNNHKIPLGWALDKHGKVTEDPEAALEGIVLPVGGPKGSGLALLVDILSGIVSGAAFGTTIGSMKQVDRTQNVGHFFFAMRPDLFVEKDEFKDNVQKLKSDIKNLAKADGVEDILLPGEMEHDLMESRLQNGIPLSTVILEELAEIAREKGIKFDLLN
ncbi:Ldh family oxidoreductase [Neobacillus piezotolerans]|uniref:Ldh family oxidoreductase n=1 Tax=Neobacillus piezotolerans TaxID=2259171 RepID=A0A3D8GUJ7_9BACI|nr:Ldh family oxidoreductase [Neobacillus piezotolerans]RDU38128.1 Ldh family oxidoreductase [Neobacillus piezotolerans]